MLTADMCLQNYYLLMILIINTMAVETPAFIHDDTNNRKKMIIHVPVITHTVYKMIENGNHIQGGEVVHNHHHGGHVSHVHKHEGDALHKHHHIGDAAHHHKHMLAAAHKHLHTGNGAHAHSHKGHILNDHFHKGTYGHDDKPTRVFSNAHALSGSALHSHGHLGDSFNPYDHRSSHLGYVHDPFAAFNAVNYAGYSSGMPYHGAVPPPPPPPIVYNKYDQRALNAPFQPYLDGWTEQYTPYAAPYSSVDEYNARSLFYPKQQIMTNYAPGYVNEFTWVNSQGGVTANVVQNSKQVANTKLEHQPMLKSNHQNKMRKIKYSVLSPHISALLDDTLWALHELDNLADNVEENKVSSGEFDKQEAEFEFADGTTDEAEEGGNDDFHLPAKMITDLPVSRRGLNRQKTLTTLLPYEVTEATPYF